MPWCEATAADLQEQLMQQRRLNRGCFQQQKALLRNRLVRVVGSEVEVMVQVLQIGTPMRFVWTCPPASSLKSNCMRDLLCVCVPTGMLVLRIACTVSTRDTLEH
eukprot:577539-Amphidinium_carterae.1